MRQLKSLIWKEWHESQPFLWIAWGLFIGLPVLDGVEKYSGISDTSHHFEFYTSPWVLLLGPVLAVVVGVTVTCRDVRPKLEDFWQSQPIGGTRLFVVKYVVAAAVILSAGTVPLLIEIALHQKDAIDSLTLWIVFGWLTVFSVAFAVGCIIRRTAHAAAISVVGLMVLFFLPIVFPPLNRFAISNLMESISTRPTEGWAAYLPLLKVAAELIVFAGGFAAVGLAAVRFHWQIESSKPLIYGSISSAFLILVISASYQLGTNLPMLQRVSIPATEYIYTIVPHGPDYAVYTSGWAVDPGVTASAQHNYVHRISLSGNSMAVTPARPAAESFSRGIADGWIQLAGQNSNVGYSLSTTRLESDRAAAYLSVQIVRDATTIIGDTIELWKNPSQRSAEPYCYVWGKRLFVVGDRSVVFDITDPTHPKRLFDSPVQWRPLRNESILKSKALVLPPAPGLPAVERLKFAIQAIDRWRGMGAFDGKIWCQALGDDYPKTLAMYRLISLTEGRADFALVVTYKPTLVQALTNAGSFQTIAIRDGLLYTVAYPNYLGVFTLTGPKPLTLVAHFVVSSSMQTCLPTSDGRVLVGGSELWLLGPPTHRK